MLFLNKFKNINNEHMFVIFNQNKTDGKAKKATVNTASTQFRRLYAFRSAALARYGGCFVL
jgi:hypothetical protein